MEEAALETIPFRWQFCGGNQDLTGEMYAEDDAVEVRAWDGAHGDSLILAVERTPRNRFKIAGSDGHVLMSWYDKRFGSPGEALEFVGGRWGSRFVEAVCRCDEPGECD